VYCRELNYEHPPRMPLDVMDCNRHTPQGTLELREMTAMALLIDGRPDHGQYL
jgi:hypothetical protein